MMAELKKHWKIISAAAGFMLCLAIIIFGTGGDSDSEASAHRHMNLFLTAGIFKTTSEDIGGYGFYTSTRQLAVTIQRTGGFDGSITLSGGDRLDRIQVNETLDSYIFTELLGDVAYTITCEALDNCIMTVSERATSGEIHLEDALTIDLSTGEFTVRAEDINKYAFQTNTSKIFVTVNDPDGFSGKIRLWCTMYGGDYIRSGNVDSGTKSFEFSKLRSLKRYQIKCEDLDGCEIVVSVG